MAGSRYAYVRNFELPDPVLPNTYMLVRIDGKGFHRFSNDHNFTKPNDGKALELMNEAARFVMNDLRPEITLAFGESDEYSFLLRPSCTLYKRRSSKLVTHIVSLFTSAYVFNWSKYMDCSLQYPPSFDGRLVIYPSQKEVKDYFAWRQVDTHINNLYNTTFWALVLQGNQTEREAHETLKGTVSSDKNEILYNRFQVNYDKLPAMFRKGTTLAWDARPEKLNEGEGAQEKKPEKVKARLRTLHVDIIGSHFWSESSKQKREVSQLESNEQQPWEDQDRTTDTNSLGFTALKP
ncbi:tRNAHis guanylyltransferase [Meira miltonrushii]|uniref:tRNA(His) guanylyltransferase n=1 Tax=Meira miltonrushii TaxID=1280837 RepID=A0A316VBK9_9BASI|nr:tRNAHis guanylyltransferase [Meira miltonrushii]PWN34498.1 tRNAHis guanylyltransferase [Meira miltonrushii]